MNKAFENKLIATFKIMFETYFNNTEDENLKSEVLNNYTIIVENNLESKFKLELIKLNYIMRFY
jgi:hypothetical protein